MGHALGYVSGAILAGYFLAPANNLNAQAAKPEQSRTVSVQVTRNGVITPLEIIVDGDKSRLYAQKLPSFALKDGMPVVVTNENSFSIDGYFRSFGGTRTSGVEVRGAQGFPKDKAGYLSNNSLDSRELTDLLGSADYKRFVLDLISTSQPGESLKLPVVVVSSSADLRKRVDELTRYELDLRKCEEELNRYRNDLTKAEETINTLKGQKLQPPQAVPDDGKIKQLEDTIARDRKNYENEIIRRNNLTIQYIDRLGDLLHEIRSEKFLFFAQYGVGNLRNGIGSGLSAELPTKAVSVQGVYASEKFNLGVLANMQSGNGNVTGNGGVAGNMALTRNYFRIDPNYTAFSGGGLRAGVSALMIYDRITQKGYILDPRAPNDPSRRTVLTGSGNISQALAGGFVRFGNETGHLSVAGHYGTSFGTVGGRGKEFDVSVSGLADSELLSALFHVDITRFSGNQGYFPNPNDRSKLSGTDINSKVSVAFTNGIKGFRPSVGLQFDSMGPNKNVGFMAGFGKTFGKMVANGSRNRRIP